MQCAKHGQAQLPRNGLHHAIRGEFRPDDGIDAGWQHPRRRVDRERVLVLRTVSNFDREAPGSTPAESLQGLVTGTYSAYFPALEAAHAVGARVVHWIVGHWKECEGTTPR